ncbi:MAG: ribonuclease Y [Dehalococcoidia bacterium]|nr:MAG: ribonuclease Y [Dehalococcoidia bacterium]
MEAAMTLAISLVALLVGAGASYLYFSRVGTRQAKTERESATRFVEEARARQKEILLEAKEQAVRIRDSAEMEIKDRRSELLRQERRLAQREETLERKLEAVERKERALAERDAQLEALRQEIDTLKQQQLSELQRISGLTREEAKNLLLKSIDEEVRQDAARRIHEIEQQLKDEADRRARIILTSAIQRCAADVVSESMTSVVHLPNEEMKGRIIGREGRNIRALEAATGCDVIIDETPDAVTLSGYDPVRREIARMALTRLIADGRIHPARIEEVVAKAKQDMEQIIREEGEQAAYKAGIHGLPAEIIRLLGRLRFRTSYGQNVLDHSLECAALAGMIAAELKADVQIAKRSAFLHDIGKAVDHEVEGPHALIGGEIAKRAGLHPKIVNAIAAHHYDEEPASVEAIITIVADSISGGRPGARRESLEHYIKRLEAVEGVANSFPGVERCFAIQAGREVRIVVKPEEIDDLASLRLARDVAKRIEETLQYPGQIKVTVIRETRSVEFAR